ncbi:MAG: PulJ/GspJ family protein [Waterburya sp.]
MKSKKLQKLLKKNKSNAGFTLTELLVGLFMSIFVIGALGFGLMQVLRVTQSEGSKVTARNENSRALDFISDEVRRARTVDTDTNGSGKSFDSSETVVLVLNIPEISSTGKIVYYLKSELTSDLGNWEGPQVLYRWGPPLDADGNYTNGDWQEEALIDGIDDKEIATSELVSSCLNRSGTTTPNTPKGFYACIFGDNTAQLYLTGETKTASGVANDTDSHLTDSKVVARARTRANNATDIFNSISWSVRGLGGEYECNRNSTLGTNWNMRTDFGSDSADPDNTTKWIQNQDGDRQPQPIEVNPDNDLTITSSGFGGIGCNSRGNDYRLNSDGSYKLDNNGDKIPVDGSEDLSSYDPTNLLKLKISHTVDFNDPKTFNGDRDGTDYNESKVDPNTDAVQFLKKGPVPQYGGYAADPTDRSESAQRSLGLFLYDNHMAIVDPDADADNAALPITDPKKKFIIPTAEQLEESTLSEAEKMAFVLLRDNQRIVGVEVGQNDPKKDNDGKDLDPNPGFDLQDNIFIVTSDIFEKKFDYNCFNGGGCPNP